MGLDLVDMIIEVEQTFGVALPDRELQEVRTIGAFVDLIVAHKRRQAGAACITGAVFYRFRMELLQQLPLERRQVRPAARLANLIPRQRRRKVWRKLQSEGFALPDLRLSRPAFGITVLGVLLPLSWLVYLEPFKVSMHLIAIFSLIWTAWFVTKPLAVHFRFGDATVRAAIRSLVPEADSPWVRSDVSRADVATRVRRIVADVLGISVDRVQEDSRFVEDLGI